MQQLSQIVIRPAGPSERSVARDLLAAAGLPQEGVDSLETRLWIAEVGGVVVGAVGLELHGGEALLRSLVVHPDHQGGGVGTRLVDLALEAAAQGGLGALYLLTTTAEVYFRRWGFVEVAREAVPEALGASAELKGACPASATVMRKVFS